MASISDPRVYSLSPANYYDRDSYADYVAAADLAGVSSPDDADGFMAACAACNKLVSDAEHRQWLAALDLGHYDDEAPEMPDSVYFEPDAHDREWYAEQLALLESQRPNCLGLDLTLAHLDAEIAEMRAALEGGRR